MKFKIPSFLKPAKEVLNEDGVPEERTSAQNITLVFSVCLLMVMNVLSQGSLNIALPSISAELDIPSSRIEWPITAMSLASGCLILPAGRISDIYGARRMFLGGIVLFVVSNIAAALSQTEIQLNIFRAFQGAGGAASIPAAVSILAHTFPATSPYRAIAFACFSAGAPVGSGFGSVFGGVFTQYSTWRTLFWFTAGVTVIPLVLGYFVVPQDRLEPGRDTRVDYLGTFLAIAGLVLLTFALSQGPIAPDTWKTPYIIAFLILSVLLLVAFFAWERFLVKSDRFSVPPLLPLEIFSREKIAWVLILGFLVWGSFQPLLLYAVLYYQTYAGLSPMATMVRMLPTAVSGVLVNFVFALVVPYVPGWMLLVVGALGTAFSCVLFANIVPSITYWAMGFPSLFCSVIGADAIYATSSIYIAAIAKPNEQALCGGLFQTFTQLGVAFGLAISTVVKNAAQVKAAPELAGTGGEADVEIPLEALFQGIKAAQWTCFAFSMTGFIIVIAFLRSIPVLGHRRTKKGAFSSASSQTLDVEGGGGPPVLDKSFLEAEATLAGGDDQKITSMEMADLGVDGVDTERQGERKEVR